MSEQAKHEAGNASPGMAVDPSRPAMRDTKRKRHSTTAVTAHGVLIHRIGDDDEEGHGAAERVRSRTSPKTASKSTLKGEPEAARKQAGMAAGRERRVGNAPPAAPPAQGHTAGIAPRRAATGGPAYSMPRALRMACERARQVQPRLINISDAAYACAQE
jgi:hypothetical protein